MKLSLRAARINAGYTQAELAKKIGISRALMNHLETGHAPMKAAYLFAICQIVGMSEDEIELPKLKA